MKAGCVLLATVLAAGLGGCLQGSTGEAAVDQACTSFPDRATMDATWGSQVNRTPGHRDGVYVGVSLWGQGKDEDPSKVPPTFVNWSLFAVEDRPAILQDILCASLPRVDETGRLGDPGTGTMAPKRIVQEAIDRLAEEHQNQTGIWKPWDQPSSIDETCCYILFEDHYWGAGCKGFAGTGHDGSTTVVRCEDRD